DVVSRAFFFQAADGIRVFHVTGVQTCALPISARRTGTGARARCALPRARRGGGARRDDAGRGAVRVGRVALGHGGGGGRGPAVPLGPAADLDRHHDRRGHDGDGGDCGNGDGTVGSTLHGDDSTPDSSPVTKQSDYRIVRFRTQIYVSIAFGARGPAKRNRAPRPSGAPCSSSRAGRAFRRTAGQAASSSAVRLRTAFGSTGMLGPIDVVIAAFLM